MTVATYIAACLAFCASFALLRLSAHARTEMGRLWAEVRLLGRTGLTEDEKERHARQAAVRALGGTGRLFLRLAGVICATMAPVWLADAAGLAVAGAVAAFALRPDVMAATTLAAAALVLALRRRGHGRA